MEAKFEKQTYGAVVATILETENSIVEVQERNDGVYGLIVHHRAEDRDRWDDLTAYLKPEHFDALGSVARRMRGSAVSVHPPERERQVKELVEAARRAETAMMIARPLNHMAEYIATLEAVRAALAAFPEDRKPPVDPRDRDPSKVGVFQTHNCWKCKDGARLDLCPTPDVPGNCGFPLARND